jgi:hypothetical protein
MRFSVGYELTETVRAVILQISENASVRALDQDGSVRKNGEVYEITDMVDRSAWPEGCRLIVRRERPHPGAQLSFHRPRRLPLPSDPHRPGRPRHRRARLPAPPARARRGPDPWRQGHRPSEVPIQGVRAQRGVASDRDARAHLIVWTQALVLDGELATAEPKRLRYRLLYVAGRLAFSGRRAKLHLQDTWPWTAELVAAFAKLKTLAAATG